MSAGGIQAGKAFVELGLRDKFTRGLDAAQQKLSGFGRGATAVGAGIAGAGVAMATPFAIASKVFASFDGNMANVAAVSGATGDQLDQLRARAKELGSTTQFSASQAAEAMKFLGMAGYNTEQILAGIGPVLQLAAAGGLELGTAADIASDVSSAFGLAAEDIGRVADVIAKAATSSNTTVEMMGETFKYAAPLAAAAGQSIEETAAAIGVLANSGIKASVAGTDLALILKTMADPKSAEKLNALGVATADAEGNMRSIVDVMEDVGKATAGMTEQDRLATFSDIFDRAAKSAIVLTSSGDSFRKLGAQMDAAGGSAEKMAAVMQDSLAGDATKVMSALEGVAISIGESLKAPLRAVAAALSDTLGWLAKLIDANPMLARVAAGVAAGLVVAGTAIAAVGAAALVASVGVGAFSTVLGVATTLVGFLATPVGIVVAALTMMAATLTAAGAAALYFSGVGGQAVDWVMAKFAALKAFLAPVIQGISDALASGDMALAAKIGFAGVRLAFWTGLQDLPAAVAHATVKMSDLFLKFFQWAANKASFFAGVIAKVLASGLAADANNIFKVGGEIAIEMTRGFSADFGSGGIEERRKAAEEELQRLTAEAAAKRAAGQPAASPGPPTADIPKVDAEQAAKSATAAAAQAKAEIDRAMAEAKAAAEAEATRRQSEVDAALEAAQNSAGATADHMDRVSNTGTFSGFAAGRLGGQGDRLQERIADATERAAEASEKTVDAVKSIGSGTYGE